MTSPQQPAPPIAPWVNSRAVAGPIRTGPGTLSGAVSSAKTDPSAAAPPAQAARRPVVGPVDHLIAAAKQHPDSGTYGTFQPPPDAPTLPA
jgi:hypothetical protein